MSNPRSRAPARLGLLLASVLLLAGCAPANQRPLSGAIPGADHSTPTPAAPPTLPVGSEPQLRALPDPSPGLGDLASPSPSASPNSSPPIVRTIAPALGAAVPEGAPVAVSAVLVGRGADLATASLTVDGAEVGAETSKATPQQWTIGATQALPPGSHTARVSVVDATGARGGYTWQFTVGIAATPTSEKTAETEATAAPTVNCQV